MFRNLPDEDGVMASDLKLPYQLISLNDTSDPDLDLNAIRFGASVETQLDASSRSLQALLDSHGPHGHGTSGDSGRDRGFGVTQDSFTVRQPE